MTTLFVCPDRTVGHVACSSSEERLRPNGLSQFSTRKADLLSKLGTSTRTAATVSTAATTLSSLSSLEGGEDGGNLIISEYNVSSADPSWSEHSPVLEEEDEEEEKDLVLNRATIRSLRESQPSPKEQASVPNSSPRLRAAYSRSSSTRLVTGRFFGGGNRSPDDRVVDVKPARPSARRFSLSRGKSTRSLLSLPESIHGPEEVEWNGLNGSAGERASGSFFKSRDKKILVKAAPKKPAAQWRPKPGGQQHPGAKSTGNSPRNDAWLGSVLSIPNLTDNFTSTSPSPKDVPVRVVVATASGRSDSTLSQSTVGSEYGKTAAAVLNKEHSWRRFAANETRGDQSPPTKPRRHARSKVPPTELSLSEHRQLPKVLHQSRDEKIQLLLSQIKSDHYSSLASNEQKPVSSLTPRASLPRLLSRSTEETASILNILNASWGTLGHDNNKDESKDDAEDDDPSFDVAVAKSAPDSPHKAEDDLVISTHFLDQPKSTDLDRKPSPMEKRLSCRTQQAKAESSKDWGHHLEGNNDDDKEHFIEIFPGVSCRLRSAQETLHYMGTAGDAMDRIATAECVSCHYICHCVVDAEFVLCPHCRVLNPIGPSGGGVGLGFSTEEWITYRSGATARPV